MPQVNQVPWSFMYFFLFVTFSLILSLLNYKSLACGFTPEVCFLDSFSDF